MTLNESTQCASFLLSSSSKKVLSSLLIATLLFTIFPEAAFGALEKPTAASKKPASASRKSAVSETSTTRRVFKQDIADQKAFFGKDIFASLDAEMPSVAQSTENPSVDPKSTVKIPSSQNSQKNQKDRANPPSAKTTEGDPSYTNYIFGENVADPLSNVKGLRGDYDTLLSTGSATYSYPLELPSGRNGLAPTLSLSYNSQSTPSDSLVGYGWDITESYIERSDRRGVDAMYDLPEFQLVLSGTPSEIVPVSLTDSIHGVYGERISQYFWKYEFRANGSWLLTDKRGTKYLFGAEESTQQFDPSDPSKTFRWYLQEVRDTNDNYILYTYTRNVNRLYPSTIYYTGHGASSPINQAVFRIEFVLQERTDPSISYRAGFRVETKSIIDEIRVYNDQIELTDPVRIYDFEYSAGDNGSRALLSSIAETGTAENGDRLSLPPTVFDYYKNDAGKIAWTKETITLPVPLGCNNDAQVFDLNLDGYDDILRSYLQENSSGGGQSFFSQAFINTHNASFTDQSSKYAFPEPFAKYSKDNIFRDGYIYNFFDFNGDAVTDVGKGSNFFYEQNKRVYLQNDGWKTTDGYSAIDGWSQYGPFTSDYGRRNFDANGDGLTDLVLGYQNDGSCGDSSFVSGVYLNDPVARDFSPSNVYLNNFPFAYESSGACSGEKNYDPGFRLVDLNADGLTDVVYSFYEFNDIFSASDTAKHTAVYLNNGKNGWVSDSTFSVPVPIAYTFDTALRSECSDDPIELHPDYVRQYTGVNFFDVNGDGLPDIILGNSAKEEIQRNCPQYTVENEMPDNSIYLNNGKNGWEKAALDPASIPDFVGVTYHTDYAEFNFTKGLHVAEINGDSLPDVMGGSSLCFGYAPSDGAYYRSQAKPETDLLKKISNSYGGSLELTYETSPQYSDELGNSLNPELPITLSVVKTVTENDGFGNIFTKTYQYSGGRFYSYAPYVREFSGFEKVQVDDGTSVSETELSQGTTDATPPSGDALSPYYSLKGKPLRTAVFGRNASGELVKFSEKIQKWDVADFGNERSFPKLVSEITLTYEGGESHRDTAVTYKYDDARGNLIENRQWGEVSADPSTGNFSDIGDDAVFTFTEYANNADVWIYGLPTQITLTDADGTQQSRTRYYYDGSTSIGQVTRGNLTRESQWLDTDDIFIFRKYEYDEYGNIVRVSKPGRYETDPDHFTYIEFDSNWRMYPVRITNPAGHAMRFEYDFFTGEVRRAVDANKATVSYEYDPFYRLESISVSDPENYALLRTKTEYVYDDNASPAKISVLSYDGISENPFATHYYFDGFRRLIQTRTQGETAYSVSDIAYDSRGLVKQRSTPYFDDGEAYQTPSWTVPKTAYEYDALSRVVKERFVTSSGADFAMTTFDYSMPWQMVLIDSLGHPKRLKYNAFGRLKAVDEYHIGLWYTTSYGYDTLGDLVKITDSKGNPRSFRYDSLGRLLEMEAVHSLSSSDFGIWRFEYDDNGNVKNRTDPNGDATLYSYDVLDRVTGETFGDDAVTFTYDTAANGVGRLASAVSGDTSTEYSYDVIGNLTMESRVIFDTRFVTTFSSDILGRPRSLVYPDTTRVDYSYNTAGLLEKISKSGALGVADILSNIDYAPTGQIAVMTYANGPTTTFTYDPEEMYRLRYKKTAQGNFALMDLEYSYDAVGNIERIVDRSESGAAKTLDFDYDDLYRLITAAADYASYPDYTETYEYDILGNITYFFGVGDFTYDGENPHAPTRAGAYSFSYDRNGNMTSDGFRTLVYNAQNQIVSSSYNGVSAQFSYDHSGQRSLKKTDSSKTYYANRLYELREDALGLKSFAYIFAGNERVAVLQINSPFDADSDDWRADEGDCNDWDFSVYPGAPEICEDDIDQNCDGADILCSSLDSDLDGYTPGNGDCNDADPFIYPTASEKCEDGIDQDCSGVDMMCSGMDLDGDGYRAEHECDDSNGNIYPGALELCDSIDNDCDEAADEFLSWDSDEDGYYREGSCQQPATDCNDFNFEAFPGAAELCSDGIDQNCDGADLSCLDVDDDLDLYTEIGGDCDDSLSMVHPYTPEIVYDGLDNDCDSSTLDDDLDQDGFAQDLDCHDGDSRIHPFSVEVCGDWVDQDCNGYDLECSTVDLDGDGYAGNEGDCDDFDALVNPSAVEIAYDGVDNDCNALTYEDDLDRDDFGVDADCDDLDKGRWPGNDEICDDGVDQNCDSADLSCADVDGDRDGVTPNGGDCNDADDEVYPGAAEVCGDGIDQNCNGHDKWWCVEKNMEWEPPVDVNFPRPGFPVDVTERLFGFTVEENSVIARSEPLASDEAISPLSFLTGSPQAKPDQESLGSPVILSEDAKRRSEGSQSASFSSSSLSSSIQLYYLFSDHLGSTSIITDSSGNLVNVKDYKPYGTSYIDEYIQNPHLVFPYTFTGKESDAEEGLYYFDARYYHDALGRFTSIDPAVMDIGHLSSILSDPQSLHSYAYARNNPMVFVDPDGEFFDLPLAIFDAAMTLYDVARTAKNVVESAYEGARYTYGAVTGNENLMNNAAISWSQNVSEFKEASIDTVADALSTLIPFVPAGLTKAARVADKVTDVAKKSDDINAGKRLFRYMSAEELKAVQETKLLRGGREGKTFWTDSSIKSSGNASDVLGIENPPKYRVEFKITNNPTIKGGSKAAPITGSNRTLRRGGGREYWSNDKVRVKIINSQPL